MQSLGIVARFVACVVVDSWLGEVRALSCEDVWWTVKFAGLWFACRACVWRNAGGALVEPRSEEERCRSRWIKLSTLRAQVAAESGLADAVRAVNNPWTAQVRKDTHVKGLGRPKEVSGKEVDFQQWSKKMEAFFAGVIKESEMMLEWQLNRQRKSRRQHSISSSCRRVGVAADAHSAHGSHELCGERHCCQLAEEPTGGVATTAETI